jgi:hypothetical protein
MPAARTKRLTLTHAFTHHSVIPPPSLVTVPTAGQQGTGMGVGRYLVVGGTGGIGRTLANRLVRKYYKVRG